MLRARHLFGLSFAFLVACGSSGSEGDTDGPGAPSPVAPPPTTPAPATPPGSTAPPSGPAPVTVYIDDGGDVPAAGVDVVFHDASGAPIGAAKTGADGKAITTGPTPAMVTALFTKPYNEGKYVSREALTWTGVKAGDVLRAPNSPYVGSRVGSYDVKLAGPAPGKPWRYYGNVGECFNGTSTLDVNVELWPECMNNTPGKQSSILVQAIDEQQNLLGVSVAKNVPHARGAQAVPITMDPFVAPASATLNVANADGVKGDVYVYEIIGSTSFQNWGGGPIDGKPKPLKVVPQADAYQVIVSVPEMELGAHYRTVARVAPTSSIEVDAARPLPRLTVAPPDVTNAARPIASWTANGSLASAEGGHVTFDWSTPEAHRQWTIVVAPGATTVQAPALPSTFAEWLPTKDPLGCVVMFVDSDAFSDADAFREDAALSLWIMGGNTHAVLPSDGMTVRTTIGYPVTK